MLFIRQNNRKLVNGEMRNGLLGKAKTSTIEVAGIALFRGEHCMGQIPAAKGLLLSLLRSRSPEWRNVDSVGGRRGQKEHVKPGSMSNKWTVSV
ncbi:hypothetical protein L3476_25180 [Paenibacillus thiaminolyticus]|uniref:hypothetical protein n=1 Tax=Paenibacillus thiaminolyticus TaxID=49283 RepID=UPI00234FF253|nr:hypothetical protein [Paenibacillus thiaminolyticus]WCR26483.1 hypothetical protein L3476_25180 [Paenibacillus thiaminolyticus]